MGVGTVVQEGSRELQSNQVVTLGVSDTYRSGVQIS